MSFFEKNKTANEEKPTQSNQQQEQGSLSDDVLLNISKLKSIFSFPTNNALKIRNLYLPSYENNVTLLYIDGTVDINLIDTAIIEPLLKIPNNPLPKIDFISMLITTVLITANTKVITTLDDVTSNLLNGNTIILIGDGILRNFC